MENNLEIDLNKLVKEAKKISISTYKKASDKFNMLNKRINSRMDFIIFQFKNIYNNNFYSGK